MNRNATATILIVLAIGIYFTFTKGMIAQAKAVQAVNSKYTSAISNADQLIRVRDQVIEDEGKISEGDRARLEKMIPNTVDNIRLIIDLKGVGVRHGMTLNNIKAVAASASAAKPSAVIPQSARAGTMMTSASSIATPTLDNVTVSFEVTAPYLEFISFLQDLEANLRIMDVSRLTMTTDDTGQYHFGVELKTYWLRQ
ncbi:MAG: hypothetical protein V4481_05590 [Patescibacteria group bacterium]